jgi:hypothetical protein
MSFDPHLLPYLHPSLRAMENNQFKAKKSAAVLNKQQKMTQQFSCRELGHFARFR